MSQPGQSQLASYIWQAVDILRGSIRPPDYKQFVLPLLFYKFLCDVNDKAQERTPKEGTASIDLANELFQIPPHAHWKAVQTQTTNVGQTLQQAMLEIERTNPKCLAGIFDTNIWTENHIPNDTLRNLIEHLFSFNLAQSNLSNNKLGQVYEDLLKNFADIDGKRSGEFFTPRNVVKLMVRMLDPQPGETVYDPACGTGGILLEAFYHIRKAKEKDQLLDLYGQEINLGTSNIARTNLLLHGIETFDIVCGDTLCNPAFLENNHLTTFDCVLANPPFSLANWGAEWWHNDPYGRNSFGVPPKNNADFAWILHMIKSMDPSNGRMAVVLPSGVLFRPRAEAKIRRIILEKDLLETVIHLGPNIFYGTSIPANILIFRARKKPDKKGKILIIDASRLFQKGSKQNILEQIHVDQILDWYLRYEDISGKVKVVSRGDVARNDWSLSIPNYIKIAPGALLANAITSIQVGIEDFNTKKESRITSAIRNIYAGILLLFKEKLLRLSPSESKEVLVKAKVIPVKTRTGNIVFEGDGRKTVDVHQIEVRFKNLGVYVDWKRLYKIRDRRNDIEHYYTVDKTETIIEVISDSFVIIRDFIRNELEEDPLELLGETCWSVLLEQDEIIEREREECRKAFSRLDWHLVEDKVAIENLKCASCNSSLVQPVGLQERDPRSSYYNCKSCGHNMTFHELVDTQTDEE